MSKRKQDKGLTGKPVIIDELEPELGGKVVQAVIDDMERAAKRRDRKKAKAEPDDEPRRDKAT